MLDPNGFSQDGTVAARLDVPLARRLAPRLWVEPERVGDEYPQDPQRRDRRAPGRHDQPNQGLHRGLGTLGTSLLVRAVSRRGPSRPAMRCTTEDPIVVLGTDPETDPMMFGQGRSKIDWLERFGE